MELPEGGGRSSGERAWAASAAVGAGAAAAGLGVYFWTTGRLPVAVALAYGALAAAALGYRTLRGRRRRQRAPAPWLAAPPPTTPSASAAEDGPGWLDARPPAAGARTPAPALEDAWGEVKSEGGRISVRMGKVARVVKSLFLLPVLLIAFAFLVGSIATSDVTGILISAGVILATCWFGRGLLRGDGRFDAGSE